MKEKNYLGVWGQESCNFVCDITFEQNPKVLSHVDIREQYCGQKKEQTKVLRQECGWNMLGTESKLTSLKQSDMKSGSSQIMQGLVGFYENFKWMSNKI